MNLKKLSVNKLLFALGILFTIGFLTFFLITIYFNSKTEDLLKNIENEQARRRVGRVIIENISVIEKNFYRITAKPHFVDDEAVILDTKNHFNQIRKAVNILKDGGTFVLTTQLNLEVASEVKENIKYVPQKENFILEYIELKPKIDVLERKFVDLVELHKKLSNAEIVQNKTEIAELSKAIYTFSKIIFSHFTRFHEDANRAYYNGTKNLLKLEKEVSYSKTQYFLIETFLFISIGLIVLVFFLLIAYRIHLINKDLQSSQKETKKAKDYLLILNDELKKEINEKELAKQQIVANEIKYRTVADWTYNWEYWVNFENQIIYMSPSVERITGFTIDDFQNDKDLMEKIIHPDDINKWSFHRKESHFTKNDDGLSEKEFRIFHKDGRIITIMHTCRNIFDENGNNLGIRASNVDITENVQLLEEIVKAKEKAEAADKLKSIFLAQMSHEIRTPINSIVSLSYIVEEELSQHADEDTTTCFSLIKNSGDRIIRTVDLILNLSEVTVGTYEKNLNIFNLVEKVLKNLFQEYHPIAKSKNLELEFEDNSVNQLIEADLYTVEQIFIQLLDNAIKYTDSGHIYIRTFLEKEDIIVVEIEDEGIGISEEYLSKLFIPFSQEQMGYTRVYEGNGIGLALVFEYCKLNKATISAKSMKGNGSTFTVRFSKYANK